MLVLSPPPKIKTSGYLHLENSSICSAALYRTGYVGFLLLSGIFYPVCRRIITFRGVFVVFLRVFKVCEVCLLPVNRFTLLFYAHSCCPQSSLALTVLSTSLNRNGNVWLFNTLDQDVYATNTLKCCRLKWFMIPPEVCFLLSSCRHHFLSFGILYVKGQVSPPGVL